MPSSTKTIIGIDPGYGRLGWAVATIDGESWKKIDLGCIQTEAKQDLFDRYLEMEQQLQTIIDQFNPTETAIESLFFFSNQKTALKVSESRGIVIACLMRNQLKISQYTPLQIKETVTGYGRADKKAVEKMVRMEFQLRDKKIIDDAIDALAVILTHSIRSRNQKYYA